jgi:hypothetical protein
MAVERHPIRKCHKHCARCRLHLNAGDVARATCESTRDSPDIIIPAVSTLRLRAACSSNHYLGGYDVAYSQSSFARCPSCLNW